jgi:hypothetical protein
MSNSPMWLNLKLDLLPSIAQEVEKITKDYLSTNNCSFAGLSDDVRKGDNQAYQELVVLQANVKLLAIHRFVLGLRNSIDSMTATMQIIVSAILRR